jgi:hypothetical protein
VTHWHVVSGDDPIRSVRFDSYFDAQEAGEKLLGAPKTFSDYSKTALIVEKQGECDLCPNVDNRQRNVDKRTEPKRRSGRTLAVGLRAIIRDKKASATERRKACEMLGVVEGLWTLADIRSGTTKATLPQTDDKSRASLQSLVDSSS